MPQTVSASESAPVHGVRKPGFDDPKSDVVTTRF